MPRVPYGPDWQLRALIARHGYSNGVAASIARMLRTEYRALARELQNPALTTFRRSHIEALMRTVSARLLEVTNVASREVRGHAEQLATMEREVGALNVASLRGRLGLPSRSLIIQAARIGDVVANVDLGGYSFANWWQASAVQAIARVQSTLQSGLLNGLNPREIARTVYSTEKNAPTLERKHRAFWSMAVRTTMTSVQTDATLDTLRAMDDVVQDVEFLAMLDVRTSLICRSYDGRRFALSDPNKPHIPLHPHCRSAWAPVVDGVELPRDQTMEQWLRSQPASVQNAALGPARAKLWREKKVTLAELVSKDGRTLTLDQLRQRLTPPIAPTPTPRPAPAPTPATPPGASATPAAAPVDPMVAQYREDPEAWAREVFSAAPPGESVPSPAYEAAKARVYALEQQVFDDVFGVTGPGGVYSKMDSQLRADALDMMVQLERGLSVAQRPSIQGDMVRRTQQGFERVLRREVGPLFQWPAELVEQRVARATELTQSLAAAFIERQALRQAHTATLLSRELARGRAHEEVRKVIHDQLRANGLNVHVGTSVLMDRGRDQLPDALNVEIERGVKFLNAIVPALKEERVGPRAMTLRWILLRPNERGGYDENTIYLNAAHQARIVVHELAHLIEASFGTAGDWGIRERTKRAIDTFTRNLPGYEVTEWFVAGRFPTTYMGKVYDQRPGFFAHTEMLSVALEMLYDDPRQLYISDPALFLSLVNFLHTFR